MTTAVHGTVPPAVTLVVFGETETATTGVAVTATVAMPCADAEATLVATTWNVPVVLGAVY